MNISLVVPVFNEEDAVLTFHRRISGLWYLSVTAAVTQPPLC